MRLSQFKLSTTDKSYPLKFWNQLSLVVTSNCILIWAKLANVLMYWIDRLRTRRTKYFKVGGCDMKHMRILNEDVYNILLYCKAFSLSHGFTAHICMELSFSLQSSETFTYTLIMWVCVSPNVLHHNSATIAKEIRVLNGAPNHHIHTQPTPKLNARLAKVIGHKCLLMRTIYTHTHRASG